MVLGDAVSTLRDACMDFEPCFKVYNLVSVHPVGIKPGQMTTLNAIFPVEVSVYRLVKIWNRPQFPAQFQNGILRGCDKIWFYFQLTWLKKNAGMETSTKLPCIVSIRY